MTFSMGELKKLCKENGYAIHTGLFGVSKNDSGKCDIYIETPEMGYSVKVFSVAEDAERVYFKRVGGYVTVKSTSGSSDYLWVEPQMSDKAKGKKALKVLLLTEDVPATELSKNCVVTVPCGCKAFNCIVHTPTSFTALLTK